MICKKIIEDGRQRYAEKKTAHRQIQAAKERTLHFEIKNMFHNKRYGNLAVDSAAKFFS